MNTNKTSFKRVFNDSQLAQKYAITSVNDDRLLEKNTFTLIESKEDNSVSCLSLILIFVFI